MHRCGYEAARLADHLTHGDRLTGGHDALARRADVLLQAAREKTGATRASLLLAENQSLYLGAGKRCSYGMICFLSKPFPVTDVYFRLLV